MSCDTEKPGTCEWYEEVDGEFKNIKNVKCKWDFDTPQFMNRYQIVNNSYYLSNRSTINYQCGYRMCDSQRTKYYKITDDLSLTILRDNYSKDRNNAYYHGLKIEQSDPDTFSVIDEMYFKAPFSVINKIYSKDASSVFFKNRLIVGADPKTFEIINPEYSKDNYHVFYKNRIIEDADPKTFVIQEKGGYAKYWDYDAHHFYYIDQKIPAPLNPQVVKTLITRSYATVYGDGENVIVATYRRNPKDTWSDTKNKEECNQLVYSKDECLKGYAQFEQFIKLQDWVVYPDTQEKDGYVLGIRHLKDAVLPIQEFTDVAHQDAAGNLIYFDGLDNLTLDGRFKGKSIKRLPITYEISSPHQININREESEKYQKYGKIEFFEDDESIYAMAVTNYSKEVYKIAEILQKNDLPIYNVRIDSNNQYIIQGNQLYRVSYDTYLTEGEDPLQILSLEIDGILKGVFKGHSADLKFVDDSGIIDARTLKRTFPKDEFGALRLSNKTNPKGIIFENDHYFFLLYPDIEDNRGDSSFQIHKEDVTVHYLSGWGGDLSRAINIEFLEYLGLDVQKVKDRANK